MTYKVFKKTMVLLGWRNKTRKFGTSKQVDKIQIAIVRKEDCRVCVSSARPSL